MSETHTDWHRRDREIYGSCEQTAYNANPPRHKLFLLTWLAIYPLITGIYCLFGSLLEALPLLLRTLLLTGVLVYLMTYFAMPKLKKAFRGWLSKP